MCENVARLFGNVLLNVFCIYLYPAWFRHRNVYQSFGKAHKKHTRNLYNLIFSTICETAQSVPNSPTCTTYSCGSSIRPTEISSRPTNSSDCPQTSGRRSPPKGGFRALNSRIVRLEVAHDDLVNVTAQPHLLGHQLGRWCGLISTLSVTRVLFPLLLYSFEWLR